MMCSFRSAHLGSCRLRKSFPLSVSRSGAASCFPNGFRECKTNLGVFFKGDKYLDGKTDMIIDISTKRHMLDVINRFFAIIHSDYLI